MADEFDPYYTWLAIPPEEQPADHYRLLGVRRFEPNLDVISNAGDQRMAFLRTFQVGKRSALSQRLLNEMAAAKVCLLDPDRRKVYDEKLKASLHKPAIVAPQMAPVPVAPVIRQPAMPRPLPAYSPPTPVSVPIRQAPVGQPIPAAPRPSSASTAPFAVADPFAEASREVQSHQTLSRRPAIESSDDISDQAMAFVRAITTRMQESPLATAAYGMLALGIVMIVSVGLWISFGGNRKPAQVAIAALGPAGPTSPGSESPPRDPLPIPSQPAKTNDQEQGTSNSEPKVPLATTTPESPSPLPGISETPSVTEPDKTVPINESDESNAARPPQTDQPPTKSVSPPAPVETGPNPPSQPRNFGSLSVRKVFPGKFPLPRKARFSSIGHIVEFAVPSQVVKIWDHNPLPELAAERPRTFATQSPLRCVGFSRSDTHLAIGTEKTLDIWELQTQKHWSVRLAGPAIDVVFCNDDQLVAVACQGEKPLTIVSLKTRGILKKPESTQMEIRSLAASEHWLAALGASGQIALYDLRRQSHHGALVHQAKLPFLSVHIKGNEVIAVDNRSVTTWDAKELKQITEWSTLVLINHPQPDVFDRETRMFTQQENKALSLFKWGGDEPLVRIATPERGFAVVDLRFGMLLTNGPDDQLVLWNIDRLRESKQTVNPTDEIAAWKAMFAERSITATSGTPSPAKVSPPVDEVTLEKVDPTTAIEALRDLGVQQLPSTPDSVNFLNLSQSKVTEADAKYLVAFPKLKSLYCEGMPFSRLALRYISQLQDLEHLSLDRTRINDDDLALLNKMTNLQSLSLTDTAITAQGIIHLKDLPKLGTLSLPQNMTREVFFVVSNFRELRSFHPMPPGMRDSDLAELSKLVHLNHMDLQQTALTPDGYRHLEKFREVESINLVYNCPRGVIPYLQNMRLQHFSFPNTARDEDIAIFSSMSSLRHLNLNSEMTDKSLESLSRLENLEVLGLENCQKITNDGLRSLRQLSKLQELRLPQHIGDSGMRHVPELRSLRQLTLPAMSQVTDEGIESLAMLPGLQSLCLPIGTTDRSCLAAAKLKNLQFIMVCSNKVSANGLRQLASLEKLMNIITMVPIDKEKLAVLKGMKTVKGMYLNQSGLSDGDVAELRKSLPETNIQIGR